MKRDVRHSSRASDRDGDMELLVQRVLGDCVKHRPKRKRHARMTLPTPVLKGTMVPTQPALKIVQTEPLAERQTEGLLVGIGILVGFSLAQLLWNIF